MRTYVVDFADRFDPVSGVFAIHQDHVSTRGNTQDSIQLTKPVRLEPAILAFAEQHRLPQNLQQAHDASASCEYQNHANAATGLPFQC